MLTKTILKLSSYVEEYICEKKFKSDFHVFGWFPGLQILEVFLENVLWN